MLTSNNIFALNKPKIIYIKVKTCANKDKVGGYIKIDAKQYLQVYVTDAPEKNKANKKIIKVLTKTLRYINQ